MYRIIYPLLYLYPTFQLKIKTIPKKTKPNNSNFLKFFLQKGLLINLLVYCRCLQQFKD